MSIELANGQVVNMSTPPGSGDPKKLAVVKNPHPHLFDRCPICGSPATSDEHVPPKSLGGSVMTRTCEPCNNRLGSYLEADLHNWLNGIIPFPRFTSENVPGARKSGRIAYRETNDGRFVFLIDGKSDPRLKEILESGEVDFIGLLPDRNRYMLALLKQAYLAMCIELGDVPQGALADQVRSHLIAARDAPSRREVPLSPLALGQVFYRFSNKITSTTLALAIYEDENRKYSGALLLGHVFVSWEIRAVTIQEKSTDTITAQFNVGPSVRGTVTSVEQ